MSTIPFNLFWISVLLERHPVKIIKALELSLLIFLVTLTALESALWRTPQPMITINWASWEV